MTEIKTNLNEEINSSLNKQYELTESDKQYRWMNEYSKITLQNGYLVNGQTVDERIHQIAETAEKLLNKEGFADKFVDYMKKGYFSLSSPIWSNFGLDRGLPISCFGSYIGDTMGDILYSQAEVGMMSKFGGGASGYFGDLRPRGSDIKDNGQSSGAVHFMKLFETLVDVVSQGSVRRGHFSPYLPLEHKDADEFLRIGSEGDPIQKLTHGVTVTDQWLNDMISGDKEKRDIWAKVIKMRSEKGYPYIMFTDNANNGTVDVYKDKGMKIHASNMCFTGDTLVYTGRFATKIKNLADSSKGEKKFSVPSLDIEKSMSKHKLAVAFSNGEKEIIELIFDDGGKVKCTKDHNFLLRDKTWCEAKDLVGKELFNNKIKVVDIIDNGEIQEVFDLTVDDYHNFYIDNGKGNHIIVHNCSEIMLPSSEEESFVCDLSSMNLFYYDEWKDTDAVEILTYFLDAVMQEFINKLKKLKDSNDREENLQFEFMRKAYKFAKRHRALGIGVIGYHSYLQSHGIAFEDKEAYDFNNEVFKLIKEQAYQASEKMAKEYGEPELLKGYGRRNTTLLAVAPTTSSAFIMNTSQSIEPVWSNCYVKDMAKMKVTIKNKELEKILDLKGHNTKEVWKSIRDRDGSVQHLDFLTEKEKNIFKTYSEINQYAVIDQAADRQKFIDQAQSINLMINPDTPAKEVNNLYLDAWKQGIKSLYYQHSKSASQTLSRKISVSCVGCEG